GYLLATNGTSLRNRSQRCPYKFTSSSRLTARYLLVFRGDQTGPAWVPLSKTRLRSIEAAAAVTAQMAPRQARAYYRHARHKPVRECDKRSPPCPRPLRRRVRR